MNIITNLQFRMYVLLGVFIQRNVLAGSIKVTRIKDGGDSFETDAATTSMSCWAFSASDINNNRCECTSDEVFSKDPNSNNAGCYDLATTSCSLEYLKDDEDLDVPTWRQRYRVAKIEFLNLNSTDLNQGIWVDLTSHANSYMKAKSKKLRIYATTEKFAGQVMKVTMTRRWRTECIYLVGPGQISYPYDFNQLFPGSIPTITITTTTTTTSTTPTTKSTTLMTQKTIPTTPTTLKTTPKTSTTTTTTTTTTTLSTSTTTKRPGTMTWKTTSPTADPISPTDITTISTTTTTTRGILPDSKQKTSDDEGGLDIGLIVGISIICVVAIALAVIAYVLYYKRRTEKQNKSTIANPTYGNGRIGGGTDPGISNIIYLTPTAPGDSVDNKNIYASVLYDDVGNKSRSGSMHSLVSTSTIDSPQRPHKAFAKDNTFLDIPQRNMITSSQEDNIYLTPVDTDSESHYSDVPTGSYTDTYAELEEYNNVTDDDEHIYREVYADPQAEYETPVVGTTPGGGNYQSLNVSVPTSGSSNMYHTLHM